MRFKLAIYAFLILVIAYFTYFRAYQYPANLFWDENYHIASAQKYLNGVFFMEPHPPLGKLFIALGEKIIAPNKHMNTSGFLTTDYIKNVPVGYSFAGVRFFPTLFAMLSAVVFFLILYNLSGRALLSFLFTSLYLFENAIITHSRGAMIESTQLFFVLLLLWKATYYINQMRYHNKSSIFWYAVLGILYGLVISSKLNGVILGFILIILFAAEIYYLGRQKKKIMHFFIKGFVFFLFAGVIFTSVYLIHFSLAKKPLQSRYYEASKQYKKVLNSQFSISNFQSISNNKLPIAFIKNLPLMFKEHISFIFHYEKGVPVYDVCKEGENGSLPITWPFGDKGINYRWESHNGASKYLYLQGNPLIWGSGLLGIFLSINLFVSYLFFNTRIKNKHLFFLIVSFLLLYILYMGVVMTIPRVMYLYHYFIPLLISFFLAYLMFLYVFEAALKKNERKVYVMVIIFCIMVIALYFFFSPLTYYQPLTPVQFELRNWFPFWGLKSVK